MQHHHLCHVRSHTFLGCPNTGNPTTKNTKQQVLGDLTEISFGIFLRRSMQSKTSLHQLVKVSVSIPSQPSQTGHLAVHAKPIRCHPHTNKSWRAHTHTLTLVRRNISLTPMPGCPQEILHETAWQMSNSDTHTHTRTYTYTNTHLQTSKTSMKIKSVVCVCGCGVARSGGWGGGSRGDAERRRSALETERWWSKSWRLTERDKRETKSWCRRFRGSSQVKACGLGASTLSNGN